MLVDAGDQFQASVRNVQVEGGGNTIQGVALNVGSGGSLSQEGLIEVKGTSATSNVRGVNVLAQEDFSASIDNVAVEGLRSALGVYWSSTDGASLIHTGTISATATDASASAAGASIMAGHDFTMTLGDIVVAGNGDGSQGHGAHVTAGEGFTGHGGDVSVTGHAFAGAWICSCRPPRTLNLAC